MVTTEQIDEMAGRVKAFRARLLEAGFVHGNSSGELVNPTGEVWVRTSYAGGEFQVDMWRRPQGQAAHEGHVRLRVHVDSPPAELEKLSDQLSRWAPKTRQSRKPKWPPAVIAA